MRRLGFKPEKHSIFSLFFYQKSLRVLRDFVVPSCSVFNTKARVPASPEQTQRTQKHQPFHLLLPITAAPNSSSCPLRFKLIHTSASPKPSDRREFPFQSMRGSDLKPEGIQFLVCSFIEVLRALRDCGAIVLSIWLQSKTISGQFGDPFILRDSVKKKKGGFGGFFIEVLRYSSLTSWCHRVMHLDTKSENYRTGRISLSINEGLARKPGRHYGRSFPSVHIIFVSIASCIKVDSESRPGGISLYRHGV